MLIFQLTYSSFGCYQLLVLNLIFDQFLVHNSCSVPDTSTLSIQYLTEKFIMRIRRRTSIVLLQTLSLHEIVLFIQRSSTSTAAAAFAIATSASSNPRELSPLHDQRCCSVERKRKESVMSTAATMRVLNVLKHWISKHPQVLRIFSIFTTRYRNVVCVYFDLQDFENEPRLKNMTIDFLEDILFSPNLLPAEHKIAGQLLRLLTMDETKKTNVDLNLLLIPSQVFNN